MTNPDCHYGDHRFADNGHCQDCDAFNGGWLQWKAVERAGREGRHHGTHFHRTVAAAESCPTPTHDGGPCGDVGGCLFHEASDAFIATLESA